MPKEGEVALVAVRAQMFMLARSMFSKSDPLSQASMKITNSSYILLACMYLKVEFSSSAKIRESGKRMCPGAPWSAKNKKTLDSELDLSTFLVEFELVDTFRA